MFSLENFFANLKPFQAHSKPILHRHHTSLLKLPKRLSVHKWCHWRRETILYIPIRIYSHHSHIRIYSHNHSNIPIRICSHKSHIRIYSHNHSNIPIRIYSHNHSNIPIRIYSHNHSNIPIRIYSHKSNAPIQCYRKSQKVAQHLCGCWVCAVTSIAAFLTSLTTKSQISQQQRQ